MGIEKERLRKLFPHLMKELEEGSVKVPVKSIRSDIEVGEKRASLSGFMPDVIDFLRRCETEEEGMEIINFLEKKGEISHEYAERLRKQLKEKGVRSFGEKKEPGYYFRVARTR